MTALPAVLAGATGLVAGGAVGVLGDRAARAYPWASRRRVPEPVTVGGSPDAGERAAEAPGPRMPTVVVVAGTAMVFAALGLKFGFSALLLPWLVLAAAASVLVPVDLRHRLLPDRVVLPATAVAAALLAGAALVTGDGDALVRALLGGAASFAVGFVMVLATPSGLGFGDVKLAALLGLLLGWLGWPVLLLGFFLGFVAQALMGVVLLTLRHAGRRSELPFGPALIAGCLGAGLLAGAWAAFPPA